MGIFQKRRIADLKKKNCGNQGHREVLGGNHFITIEFVNTYLLAHG